MTNHNSLIEERMATPEYQERLVRDTALCERVQAGYTSPERTKEDPHPRIIDGVLDEDAQEALGELSVHYENLTAKLARKYNRAHNRTSIDLEDLKQQGYFGIYHAAVTFDQERNTSFTTHARITIGSHLTRFINEHESLIRVPADVRGAIRSYGRAIWATYQTQERMPTRRQIAHMSGKTPEEVDGIAIAEAFTTQMGSIDEGYYTDGRDRKSILEAGEGKWKSITPEATATRAVDIEATTKVLGEVIREVLAEGEDVGDISQLGALVIRLRIAGTNENEWKPMLLDEVADVIKQITGQPVTRERVRQIESKTLAVLRHPKIADRIRPFFDAT